MEQTKCPQCGAKKRQHKQGFNRSGTQRYRCMECGKKYTPEAKRNEYSEEIKMQAMKIYYSGVSGRGVGKIFGMSKANIYNWLKKTTESVDK